MGWRGAVVQTVTLFIATGLFLGLFYMVARLIFRPIDESKKRQMAENRRIVAWGIGAFVAGAIIGSVFGIGLERLFSVDRDTAHAIELALTLSIMNFFGWTMWQSLRTGKL
jgi:cytochrome bd-type quinol oxidase subunit 2